MSSAHDELELERYVPGPVGGLRTRTQRVATDPYDTVVDALAAFEIRIEVARRSGESVRQVAGLERIFTPGSGWAQPANHVYVGLVIYEYRDRAASTVQGEVSGV